MWHLSWFGCAHGTVPWKKLEGAICVFFLSRWRELPGSNFIILSQQNTVNTFSMTPPIEMLPFRILKYVFFRISISIYILKNPNKSVLIFHHCAHVCTRACCMHMCSWMRPLPRPLKVCFWSRVSQGQKQMRACTTLRLLHESSGNVYRVPQAAAAAHSLKLRSW